MYRLIEVVEPFKNSDPMSIIMGCCFFLVSFFLIRFYNQVQELCKIVENIKTQLAVFNEKYDMLLRENEYYKQRIK